MPKGNDIPDFEKMAEELLKGLPMEVAELALNHFDRSFIDQGFTDTSFIAWPKRLDDQTFGLSHPLLNKSGALQGSLMIKAATMKRVEVAAGDNLRYAAIHNNGGTIRVTVTPKMRKFFWFVFTSLTKHYASGAEPPPHILKWKHMALTKKDTITIKVAKRQFIGQSEKLLKDVDQLIVNKILTAFKNNTK